MSSWEPVAHDEPFTPHDLEPYGPEPESPPPPGVGETPVALADVVALRTKQARALAERGVRSLVEDGPSVTARRASVRGRQIARWVARRIRP